MHVYIYVHIDSCLCLRAHIHKGMCMLVELSQVSASAALQKSRPRFHCLLSPITKE